VKSIHTWPGSVGGANTTRAAAGARWCPRFAAKPSFSSTYHRYMRLWFTTHPSRTSCTLQPAVAEPAPFFGQLAQPLATGRPPAAAHTDASHDESGSARRPVARRPLLASASLSLPAFALFFFFSSSRSGIGKLTRRSRVAKVEIPPQLRDLQAQWESPDLSEERRSPRLLTHKLCYRVSILT
jgi:hypothetical protein